MSVSKDPKFIKGYLRLSTAQAELQLFDDAETTLKAAQALEPGTFDYLIFLGFFLRIFNYFIFSKNYIFCLAENELIGKQLKVLKTKKAAASAAAKAKRGPKKLDEAQMKEVSSYNFPVFSLK